MDLIKFEEILRYSLSSLPYIQHINIKQRTEISLQGTIDLKENYQLNIFFNEVYNIMSFSLIYRKKRIWAIDRDNRIGWHLHQKYEADKHEIINSMTIPQIIIELDNLMKEIYS